MDKLHLTEDVRKSLSFLTEAALKFVGYPAWIKHIDTINGNVESIPIEKPESPPIEKKDVL